MSDEKKIYEDIKNLSIELNQVVNKYYEKMSLTNIIGVLEALKFEYAIQSYMHMMSKGAEDNLIKMKNQFSAEDMEKIKKNK